MFDIIIISKIGIFLFILIFFFYFLINKYKNKILTYLFYLCPKNTSKYIKIIKNKYDIKSTEKTDINNLNLNLKLIAKKPYYFKFNNIKSDNLILNIKNNQFDNYMKDKNNEKIMKLFIYNKKIFTNLFFNSNEKIIKDLDTFNIFHIKNTNTKLKYNILMKFFNNSKEYLYIYINDINLVKIINNDEYDYIVELIENKNNIFLIKEKDDNYITHGGYIESKIIKKQMKKIFFSNAGEKNKNFKILKNFTDIKIYFYVSTLI